MSYFTFETLDVYRLAVQVARWMRTTRWPANASHLRDQAIRAADSVVLNLAEGLTRGGRAGVNHLRISKASAGEAYAALDVADFAGCAEKRAELQRIAAMISRLRVP
ncbi:MAG: four helix bundle protein [Alphaproteobacteria bacterium]|nr:four helix bundle protein [Alphaproteobacteria bacterium]MCB9694037.1 four helix bundle protein [Alphaproteobacteria bacterium]